MAMKVRIVAVGKVKEAYLREGIAEYAKRLAPYCKLEIAELKDEGLELEAARLEKYLGIGTYILGEEGGELSSQEFAALIGTHSKVGEQMTFIIGGAYGISPELKKKAKIISLSRMTFTHEMARLVLLEQVYRAFLANSGRSYQK